MMKRYLTLAALAALLLVPAARAVAAPAPAVHHGGAVSSVIPPEYCFAVFGQDYEKFLCSDGSGAH